MLIIMQVRATSEEVDNVVHRVESLGLKAHLSSLGEERVIIGAIGEGREALEHLQEFTAMIGVDRVMPISRPYKLASREFSPQDTSFSFGRSSYWRRGNLDHRRSLCCRKPQPDVGDRPGSERSWSPCITRWCIQTPHFSLFVSGYGNRWPGNSC